METTISKGLLYVSDKALAPRSATCATSPRRDPHIPEPDTFDGNVESCRGFLLQCCRVFDHKPRTYIMDREKISYIINRLRGKALLWYVFYTHKEFVSGTELLQLCGWETTALPTAPRLPPAPSVPPLPPSFPPPPFPLHKMPLS
uniref:DUF4939 domain-containing protein n=1 Tax=Monopterus albus TaxID=43700 RepID=A0A3Q3KKU3_MONAL